MRWRGAEVERLLNRDHSLMHERVASMLARAPGWLMQPEVSFSIWGERGVIDILAFHEATGHLLVIELKTSIVDVQAMLGTVDRYRRLAAQIGRERGWLVKHVSLWVAVADTGTNRRRLAEHRTVLRSALPSDGRHIEGWLSRPNEEVAVLSFLANPTGGGRTTPIAARRRVRRRKPWPGAHQDVN